MCKKRISFLPILMIGLVCRVLADIPIDNFEEYDNSDLLHSTWKWVWTSTNSADLERYLDTLDSPAGKTMRMEFDFPGGSTNAMGAVGLQGSWSWAEQTGIRLWIKARATGDAPRYFKVRFHENDAADAKPWNAKKGDKWESPLIAIDTLDTNGQYVDLNFDDFTRYGGFGGANDNGILDLENIYAFYVVAAFSGTATNGGTITLWVDDVSASGGPAMVRYPYLQNVTQNSVDVMWGTYATSGTLYWGTSSGVYTDSVSSTVFEDAGGRQVHTATITGLTPGQTVYYYVISGSDTVGLDDPSYHAVTAPAGDASFRFIDMGDSHYKPVAFPRIIKSMISHDPDLVISTGDLSKAGYIWQMDYQIFGPIAPLAKNTPLFTAIGNHDAAFQGGSTKNYSDLFSLPTNSADGTEDYYSFDYGIAHFISLDTELLMGGYRDPARAAEMKTWLINDLSATTKQWKIVFFHKQTYWNEIDMALRQIFEDNGVDLVFSGHTHTYDSHKRNGVVYITSGGANGPIVPPAWEAWQNYRIKGFMDYNFVRVDVTPEKLDLNVYNDNNVLRYWLKISSDGEVTYPPTEPVDDFEAYADDVGLRGVWRWVGVVPGVQMNNTQIYLETEEFTGNKVIRVESSFSEDGRDGYGYAGISGLWNWNGYNAIRLWVKPKYTGYPNQYFQIRLHEASGGEKWKSVQVNLNDIDPKGEYVYLYFDDFVKYYNGSGELSDNKLNLNAIISFFIIPGYNGLATSNGTSTLLVDNITASVDSLSTATMPVFPGKFNLYQNYPNPFNPVTTIQYDIPQAGDIKLTVYDLRGREVITLVNNKIAAGSYAVKWDGRNSTGDMVGSGIYLYRLEAENFSLSKKLVLIK
ncbi:MAG: T9SS type A sorting domain-containing protein [FCB group bacterium]|nr:T9SS type A sorting domain-containing protein [FCB group bacterium]